MKKCTSCLLVKQLSDFYLTARKSRPGYFQSLSVCKLCSSFKQKLVSFNKKQIEENNPNKFCTKCKVTKLKTDFPTTKGKIQCHCKMCGRQKSRALYKKHHDKEIQRFKTYRENNREKTRKTSANWRKKNPEKVKEQKLNQKKLPKSIVKVITQQFNYCCAYCEKFLDNDYTIDHVYPQFLGGGSNLENLVLACRPCNSQKYHKTIHEWLRWIIDNDPCDLRISRIKNTIQYLNSLQRMG